ncbi:hypothetical protein BJ979_000624 [Schumannella luteola]|uniref:Uncharacterized protein n=1 Tax=Schumannella luteola TaxID=472059 RepID=A0A852YG22_9MICO|nr:hypothetical protein [Schumannella luteola]NYG97998.1 hypothetical protein [Schumannella luteola]
MASIGPTTPALIVSKGLQMCIGQTAQPPPDRQRIENVVEYSMIRGILAL